MPLLAIAFLAAAAGSEAPPRQGVGQENGQEVRLGGQQAAEALLRRVLDHRKEIRPIEGRLRFRQRITTEALDENREVTGTASALYEYTPVAGRHLWKLLELDEEPIGRRRWRREERRYRNAVKAARKEAEADREAEERGDTDYEVRPKNGMDLFYEIVRDAMELDMFEGELFAGEPWGGRAMQIVRFRPRSGTGRLPNRMMSVVSKCRGELWVDPAELQIARVRTELLREESFALGLFGRLFRGTSADVSSEFDGRIWLPQRVTLSVDARMYFFRRIRRRVHYDFLDFEAAPASP